MQSKLLHFTVILISASFLAFAYGGFNPLFLQSNSILLDSLVDETPMVCVTEMPTNEVYEKAVRTVLKNSKYSSMYFLNSKKSVSQFIKAIEANRLSIESGDIDKNASLEKYSNLMIDANFNADVKSTVIDSYTWQNKKVFTVRFLNVVAGLSEDKERNFQDTVISLANTYWGEPLGISFQKVDYGKGDIRIQRKLRGVAKSLIGKEANTVDHNSPTMTLTVSLELSSRNKIVREVIHEFGHALGCVHEQFNPSVKLEWIDSVVYSYYRNIGLDSSWVSHNVFGLYGGRSLYPSNRLSYSNMDSLSVMIYELQPEFTKNRFAAPFNVVPSNTDITFLRSKYQY